MDKLGLMVALVSLAGLVSGCNYQKTQGEREDAADSVCMEVDSALQVSELSSNEDQPSHDPKLLSTAQLDAFALMGDVHVVNYDSLILKYSRDGELEYFGFNDTINLLQDVESQNEGKYRKLKKWGADGWMFEIRAQSSYLSDSENSVMDFLIHYPEGGYDRYIMERRPRPGSPRPMDEDYGRVRIRQNTLSAEYRNFRRKGDYPKPDVLVFSDYVYDQYGNWIERTVKSEHRSTKHEKRTITYYSQE